MLKSLRFFNLRNIQHIGAYKKKEIRSEEYPSCQVLVGISEDEDCILKFC